MKAEVALIAAQVKAAVAASRHVTRLEVLQLEGQAVLNNNTMLVRCCQRALNGHLEAIDVVSEIILDPIVAQAYRDAAKVQP